MNDLSRYEQADDTGAGPSRRVPRMVWVVVLVVLLAALVVTVVVVAGGGHDPSQFDHG